MITDSRTITIFLASSEELMNDRNAICVMIKEIDEILNDMFSFDNFKWQKENNVEINEEFRADGLHRILYKCSECRR